MELFFEIIETLVALGFVASALKTYFSINKIWSRKYIIEVTESISIISAILGVAMRIPVAIKFGIYDTQLILAASIVVSMIGPVMELLIGIGYWVKDYEGMNIFRLLLKSLKDENQEKSYLFKSAFRPDHSKIIINILQKIATIDHDVSAEELKLIDKFTTD